MRNVIQRALVWLAQRRVVLLYMLGCQYACSSASTPAARSLRVTVQDDEGRRLAGVPVEIDGISVVKTQVDGTVSISLSPSGPARARIGVGCTTEYREVAPRHIPRFVAGGSAKLELDFTCRPLQRTLAVVVRAPGAQGLWLRADGEPLGRIEADGTLHATLSREPDSELRLMIDTEERALTPRNPVRELRVADRDELVIFDQPLLAVVSPPKRKLTPIAPRAAPLPLPYAIRGNGH